MCIAKTSFEFADIHDLHKCSEADSVRENSGSNLVEANTDLKLTAENSNSQAIQESSDTKMVQESSRFDEAIGTDSSMLIFSLNN